MGRVNLKTDKVYPVDYMFQKVEELKQIIDNDVIEINGKVDDHTSQLTESVKYPVLSIETGKVVNKTKPYGHVERYGANPTFNANGDMAAEMLKDSTVAIQTAVDLMEELAKGIPTYTSGFFPVQFGAGSYLITKTIRMKYDSTIHNADRPITIIGAERKRTGDSLGKGTQIHPYIPNHTGKTYANAFAINVKYNSNVDEDDTHAFGGGTNAPIMDNITIKNITFKLTETSSQTYNICGVKAYRTRLNMQNIFFDYPWRCVWQPNTDRLGASSYCDFSYYDEISINGLGYIGLELCTPDNTHIGRIIHHKVRSTIDCILKIKNGAGITVRNFQSAFHGTFANGVLTPRNDGTGATGTKAYIKLDTVTGISFDGLYIERPLCDYMFSITNSLNISVNNYYERFFGNGFMSFSGINKNIRVENVYKHSNLVSDYTDFFVQSGASLQNVKIKNFYPRNWYTDVISLATNDYTTLTTISGATFTTRDIKHNFTYAQIHQLEGEEVSFKIQYDGANWIAKDRMDNDITSSLGGVTWNTDGLDFTNSKFAPMRLVSVSEGYISATSLPHVPIFRAIGTDKIRFFDRATGNAISSPDIKCCAWVTINSIYNLTKLP